MIVVKTIRVKYEQTKISRSPEESWGCAVYSFWNSHRRNGIIGPQTCAIDSQWHYIATKSEFFYRIWTLIKKSLPHLIFVFQYQINVFQTRRDIYRRRVLRYSPLVCRKLISKGFFARFNFNFENKVGLRNKYFCRSCAQETWVRLCSGFKKTRFARHKWAVKPWNH